jgi:hypothetical protein
MPKKKFVACLYQIPQFRHNAESHPFFQESQPASATPGMPFAVALDGWGVVARTVFLSLASLGEALAAEAAHEAGSELAIKTEQLILFNDGAGTQTDH